MSSSSSIAPQSSESLSSRKKENTNDVVNNIEEKPKNRALEFAHSFPIHTKSSSSILSQDSTEKLSFRGFGNLGRMSPCNVYAVLISSSPCYDIRQSTTYSGELCQGMSDLFSL